MHNKQFRDAMRSYQILVRRRSSVNTWDNARRWCERVLDIYERKTNDK